MAGVAVTAGTGTTIAADNIGSASAPSSGERLPYTKLDHGAAGSSSPVTVLNPLPASAPLQWIQVTPTLDTSAYASGDLLFDVVTITSAALASGGAVELVSVIVCDQDDQKVAMDLYVTNLSTTWGTFNAAPTLSDAGGLGIQAIIPIAAADFKDLGGVAVAQPSLAQNIGAICETSGSANLYLAGVNGAGTPTFTASGLKISLGFRQTAVS
jgi:hypothetical protein